MKPRSVITGLLAVLFALADCFAQSTTITHSSVSSPATAVETRTTTTADGKTIVERLTTTSQLARETTTHAYVAAVLVSNRAEATLDAQVQPLEDLLAARLADLGFRLVSRELVLGGLRPFTPSTAPVDRESARASAAAEAALLDQTSALRLAQGLGADYVLHASILSLGVAQRTVTAYGNTIDNQERTMRVAYRLADARSGGALTGDVITASLAEQGTSRASTVSTDTVPRLLDEVSRQIAASLRTRVAAGPITATRAPEQLVTITLHVEAADLFIPDVRIGSDNVVAVGESRFKVVPYAATVEVDGVTVGTAPGRIALKPGFSRLRLTREGFKPWERTISASDGQTLSIAMTMSEEGLARFRSSTAWINELKSGAKLTDAAVKLIEGQAKSLENSFFRVETTENFRFILPDRLRELRPVE